MQISQGISLNEKKMQCTDARSLPLAHVPTVEKRSLFLNPCQQPFYLVIPL